ncbi:winged helix-turn-helix domain-containing protein [Actinomadura miaoliensis]|uniref:Winged helix-turn-helix domain-containing protein n=1 Tax=Actinomadura miaoliensis TaxID=430685 RepID=A0ABP7X589_9ACTN
MLRVHFTADDLQRVQLAPGPDALWEILLSLCRLRRPQGEAVFGQWKRQVTSQLPASIGMLTALAPPSGYAADFLTPTTSTGTLRDGLAAVRATPRARLRTDLTELATRHPHRSIPSWGRSLADGRPQVVQQVTASLADYFAHCLAPYWPRVRAQVDRDRHRRRQQLDEGGWPRVLSTIHPTARWSYPVLELDYPADHDIALDGRGLVLQPSFFCWGPPVTLLDPALPPVLAYPVTPAFGWAATDAEDGSRSRALTALLGDTRANVLKAIADGACSTTQLAGRVQAPPPTVSRQAAVLRDAGLIRTQRAGKRVEHSITPLGTALLQGDLDHDQPSERAN